MVVNKLASVVKLPLFTIIASWLIAALFVTSPEITKSPFPLIVLALVPPVKVKPFATLFVIPFVEVSKSALLVKEPLEMVILPWEIEALLTISDPTIKEPLPVTTLPFVLPLLQVIVPSLEIAALTISDEVVKFAEFPIIRFSCVIEPVLSVSP